MENKSRMLYGSINVTNIIDQLKKSHNGFIKAENGNIYANVRVWLNEEPDQYKNDASIQITAKPETNVTNFYIGNLKYSVMKEKNTTIEVEDLMDLDLDEIDDLPF